MIILHFFVKTSFNNKMYLTQRILSIHIFTSHIKVFMKHLSVVRCPSHTSPIPCLSSNDLTLLIYVPWMRELIYDRCIRTWSPHLYDSTVGVNLFRHLYSCYMFDTTWVKDLFGTCSSLSGTDCRWVDHSTMLRVAGVSTRASIKCTNPFLPMDRDR